MWPTRYSRQRRAFINVREMKAFIDATHDSDFDSDGMVGDDFNAERSVYTDDAGAPRRIAFAVIAC